MYLDLVSRARYTLPIDYHSSEILPKRPFPIFFPISKSDSVHVLYSHISTAQLLLGVIERLQLQLQFLRLPLSILRINTWSLFIKPIQHKYGIH